MAQAKKLMAAPDPKAIWAPALAATDPRTLYLALIGVFMAAAIERAPDGTPWRLISVNLATEVVTVHGNKRYALNEAYRIIAQGKNWQGPDLDPLIVCQTLIDEGSITGGWHHYTKKSGNGRVNAFKVALNDGSYVKAEKPSGKTLSDFGG